jgi:hypothetical protein
VTLLDHANGLSYVAAGSHGYVVLQTVWETDDMCGTRIVHMSEDLADVDYPAWLGFSTPSALHWIGDEYRLAYSWGVMSGGEVVEGEIVVARLSARGHVMAPPYRNSVGRYHTGAPALAAGDGGLTIVAMTLPMDGLPGNNLLGLMRTDMNGCAFSDFMPRFQFIGHGQSSYNNVWADGFFGVIFDKWPEDALYFVKLVESP